MEGDDTDRKVKTYEASWLHKRVSLPKGGEGTVTRVVMWRDDAGRHLTAWVAVDGAGMSSFDVLTLAHVT